LTRNRGAVKAIAGTGVSASAVIDQRNAIRGAARHIGAIDQTAEESPSGSDTRAVTTTASVGCGQRGGMGYIPKRRAGVSTARLLRAPGVPGVAGVGSRLRLRALPVQTDQDFRKTAQPAAVARNVTVRFVSAGGLNGGERTRLASGSPADAARKCRLYPLR